MMLTRLIRIVIASCFPLSVMGQFCINGIEPAYDTLTNTYLFSIDENHFDRDYEADVSLKNGSSWNSMTIEGKPIGTFTFSGVTGNKSYTIRALSDEGEVTAFLKFTFLPIIHFKNGIFGYDYTADEFSLQYNGIESGSMKAEVKWRGGTTNTDGRNKRNYKIKLIDDQGNKVEKSFFGLRKDNVWILDAGQVDMFRMRNLIASQIWQDFAAAPYYITAEPKALTSTRGHMVEVFLGDQYQGIFNLCEPIDRKQMRLKKYERDGTIHGGLWKASSNGDATFWNIPSEYDNTKEQNDVWEIKYPKVDDLCPSDYSTLRNAIMFVATASDDDFNSYVADYFDMPVLVDYYLFVALTNGFDICGKNVYWAVYDKEEDKKLTLAMWDLDCTMGQNYTDNPLHPEYVSPTHPLLVPNKIFYRLKQLNVGNFNEIARQRYEELRENLFSTESLQQRYTNAYNLIFRSGAAEREEQRWSYNTDIAELPLNFAGELDYICRWIRDRMEFLDKHFSYTPSGIKSTRSNNVPQDNHSYTLTGTIAHNNYNGITIVKGRKIVCRK